MDRLVIIVSVVQTPPALVHWPPGVTHKSCETLLAWVMLIFLSLQYFAPDILGLTCDGHIPSEVAVAGSGAVCVVVALLKPWTLAALSPQL